MATKIYVGGLNTETTEDELREFFMQHGDVVTVEIIKGERSGASKGFGFVEMPSAEEAQKAITILHGKDLDGRKITVSQARLREGRTSGGGKYRNSF